MIWDRLHNGENEVKLMVAVDGKWENEQVKKPLFMLIIVSL